MNLWLVLGRTHVIDSVNYLWRHDIDGPFSDALHALANRKSNRTEVKFVSHLVQLACTKRAPKPRNMTDLTVNEIKT